MGNWRVCSGIAQPHIEASIIGGKSLRACHAIGHPANGCVKDAMHEEDSVPGACKASQYFQLHAVTKLTTDCSQNLARKQEWSQQALLPMLLGSMSTEQGP